jgi:hypothetical protein
MKKLILLLAITTTSQVSIAQHWNSVVQVNRQVVNADTLRTFFLDGRHAQNLIEKFTTLYGAPQGPNIGTMTWSNVPVTGVANGMTIQVSDGAMVPDGTTFVHSPFLNAADMELKLSADPARFRRMLFTFKVGNNNGVTTAQAEAAAVKYVENLIFN